MRFGVVLLVRPSIGEALAFDACCRDLCAHEVIVTERRTNNPNWGRAGLERAQLELSVITSQLRLRGLLE